MVDSVCPLRCSPFFTRIALPKACSVASHPHTRHPFRPPNFPPSAAPPSCKLAAPFHLAHHLLVFLLQRSIAKVIVQLQQFQRDSQLQHQLLDDIKWFVYVRTFARSQIRTCFVCRRKTWPWPSTARTRRTRWTCTSRRRWRARTGPSATARRTLRRRRI